MSLAAMAEWRTYGKSDSDRPSKRRRAMQTRSSQRPSTSHGIFFRPRVPITSTASHLDQRYRLFSSGRQGPLDVQMLSRQARAVGCADVEQAGKGRWMCRC